MSKTYVTLELDKEEYMWLLAFTGSTCTKSKTAGETPNYRIYDALQAADPVSKSLLFNERFDGEFPSWPSIDAHPLCDALISRGILK